MGEALLNIYPLIPAGTLFFQSTPPRGGTVGNWPLNVFNKIDAAAELPMLRAIAVAELHNLVFQADYTIVPAIAHATTQGETE